MAQNNNKPLVLVMLAGGGFAFETKRLLMCLLDDADFIYLKTEWGGVPGEGGFPAGESRMVPTFSTVTQRSFWRNVNAFLRTFAATLDVLRKNSVTCVMVVGCSHAVPMFLGARMLRCKTIYLESVTRVDQLSISGKIVYYLKLAKTFIVQWPELRDSYPGSQLGTIL